MTISTSTDICFGNATGLSCRECGATYELGAAYACAECFARWRSATTSPACAAWASNPDRATSGATHRCCPSPPKLRSLPTSTQAGPRCTPPIVLPPSRRHAQKLWIKDDSGNPTHSFKDRVVGWRRAPRGRSASRLSPAPPPATWRMPWQAAAARAGMGSAVLIPSNLEAGKTVTTACYGGLLLAVEGNYDDVNRLCSELIGEPATAGWGFVNVNLRPYYAEGSKTVGYEIAEQLGWRLPQQVVAPVASGSLLTKVDKAWRELGELGFLEPTDYRVFGAQAGGCSPVAQAFDAGWDVVRPVKPDTIAKSLAIGNPADGPYALDAVRRSDGAVAAVSDEEIVAGIQLLARTEGVFAETAGGVVVATLKRLLASPARSIPTPRL